MANYDLKVTLKEYFKTGKVPTESQFAETIDAVANASFIDSGIMDNQHLPSDIDLTVNSPTSSVKASQLTVAQGQVTGNLQVDSNADVGGNLAVIGGLNVKGFLSTESESLTLLAASAGAPARDMVIKGQRGNQGELAILTFNESAGYISVPVLDEGVFKQDEVAGKTWVNVRVNANSEAISNEATRATGAESQLQQALDQEVLDRQTGDQSLQTQLNTEKARVDANTQAIVSETSRATTAESQLQQTVDQEVLDRQAGDQSLQTQLDTEQQRINSILAASTADKDSFAEIVQLINTVDTESDQAFSGYVLQNNTRVGDLETALGDETTARENADSNLQTAIDGKAADNHSHNDVYYPKADADGRYLSINGGQLQGDLNVTGQIVATGDITAFSDIRLKKAIEPIAGALDKVRQLNGVTYSRKDFPDQPRRTGLIAQDVEAVLPEAVQNHGDHLSVAYGNMVGLLVESIKELSSEVDALRHELATLTQSDQA